MSTASLNAWRVQVRIVELLPTATTKTREKIIGQLTAESRRWSCTSSAEFDAMADLRLQTLCKAVEEGVPSPKSVAEQNRQIRYRNRRRRAQYYPLLPPKEVLETEIPEPSPVCSIPAPPARREYIPMEIDPKDRALIDRAISIGIRKILPAKLRHKKSLGTFYLGVDPVSGDKIYEDRFAENQIVDDIRSKVWEKLLEPERGLYKDGKPNTKDAYNWARRLCTDWLRQEYSDSTPNGALAVASQQNEVTVQDDDANEGGASPEIIMPWDQVDLSKPAQFEESVYRLISASEDGDRRAAVHALKTERPEDYQFIVSYAEGLRDGGRRYSLQERQRALNIRRWLKRRSELK
jgi:hypothetical protein